MERKLASVQVISAKIPIAGADNIEAVKVNEWWCVAKKDEFKVDEKVVYIEIDSFLPADREEFKFLMKKPTKFEDTVGYRLRTIKLKGQLSQGLVIPLSEQNCNLDVDSDLTEYYGIKKFEKYHYSHQTVNYVKVITFPPFLVKTDEERVQNLTKKTDEIVNIPLSATEKVDGMSCTMYKRDGKFGVCSRNQEVERGDNLWWHMAEKYNVEKFLPDNFAIQGEVIGPGCNDNRLELTENDFLVFNVHDINAGFFYTNMEMFTFCRLLGFKHVPEIGVAQVEELSTLIEMSNGMYSKINPALLAEGIVFRSDSKRRFENGGRFSFKSINNQYLTHFSD